MNLNRPASNKLSKQSTLIGSVRVVVFIISAIVVVGNAFAQNTFPSSGNVGIGTTSPQYKLDVVGDINVGSGSAFRYAGTPVIQAQTQLGNYFFGNAANPSASAYNNTAVGNYSLTALTNGTQNTAVGGYSMSQNTTGAYNVAFGYQALNANVAGIINAAIGGFALANSTGSFNTALGGNAITNTTGGSYNIGIGANTSLQNGNDLNEIVIGASATGNGSNSVTIGNSNSSRTLLLGNVGIGTATPGSKLEVDGSITLTAKQGGSITFQDGSVQSVAWNGVLQGGDYAESVDVSGDRAQYVPGDVLVVDPAAEGRFLKSSQPYSTAVMGIYSTRPGVVGRRQKSDRSHMAEEVPMAMIGVVPTKVTAEGGPIKPGDLLVTSSTPGYAMKGTDHNQMMGAIIGKALGHLNSGTGLIEVAVSLQ